MRTLAPHRKLLLSTAAAMGALSGYGKSAYAACVPGAPPTFVCSGANVVQQNIALTNATVSTVPGFSVITGAARGVNISGTGALSFTDTYASTLTASGFALYARTFGDAPGSPGSITVSTDGTLTGGADGLFAINFGTGAVDITTDGDVTGTARYGILTATLAGGGADLTVTTGAGTTVAGGRAGILAFNSGAGATNVTANGDLTGTTTFGIDARHNTGTDLTVTTGSGTTVVGAVGGIRALNSASGATTITADGDVTGTAGNGIYALNAASTTDLTVATGSGTTVAGGTVGIRAVNNGSGATTITADGDVTGTTGDGIYASNAATATDLTVTASAVTGGSRGIFAGNDGSGALQLTATGDVTGTLDNGIYARNAGTELTMTTGAVTGGSRGIRARNDGSGALQITANGDITGTLDEGIYARNDGTYLSVATGAGATVTGRSQGIAAFNNGSGAFSITADGAVYGTTFNGIYALNDASTTNLTVTTGTTVTGGSGGIRALNSGTGATTITADGAVTGTTGDGIYARNAGTDLTVTAGAVTGGSQGIAAFNDGSGTTSITANGDVTGSGFAGISVQHQGSNLDVTTGVGTQVTSSADGIRAFSRGTGRLTVTANGDVVSTSTGDAVFASLGQSFAPSGTDLTVTTSGTVSANTGSGILAVSYGSGATTVTTNGNVTSFTQVGIGTQTYGTDLTITANRDVAGNDFGISASHYGSGTASLAVNGAVTGSDAIIVRTSGTSATVTTGPSSAVTGLRSAIQVTNFGSGPTTITADGNITGTNFEGVRVFHSNDGDIDVTTVAGSSVSGGRAGIYARSQSSSSINITTNDNVTGAGNDGVYARSAGGLIDITVNTSSAVTSNGVDAADFAIETFEGPADVAVAGTLNGGAGGAVQFDQVNDLDDRLELRTTGVVNGNALAGGGTDTLAFAGSGNGNFNLSNIDDGSDTRQYRDFEDFIVESATWTLNGTTGADFLVNGGTVKGNGTFGSLTVNNGGTLSPGNSFGTVTVNGVFSLNPGAVFEVEVNAANQGDLVVVNGTVNLTGATLRILAAPGDYKLETDYVIIDNDGTDAVNGVFGTITSTLAFLIPTVAYDGGTGNDVVLTLTRNEVYPCDVANTPNQSETCGAITPNNPLYPLILGQTAAGARQAFNALSGEIHASAAGVLADDNRYVREAILGRLMQASHTNGALAAGGPQAASLDTQAYALGFDGKSLIDAPTSAPLAFWTRAFGAWGDFDTDGNAASADRDLGGFVSGMDAQLSGSWRAGLTTGASFSNVSVDARYSAADTESYYLGGYLGGMAGAFALRGGGTWAWSEIDTSRAVIFPGFFERQKANYDADIGQIFGETAYPMTMGGMSVEPFAGLAYVSLDTDTFVEHGGPLASLRGRNSDQDVGYTTLGLRVATTAQWRSMLVTPHLSVRWQHAFDDVTPSAALAFATTGAGFTVEGVPLAQDSALLDAGLDFAVTDRVSAGVSYTGQYGDGVTDNGVKGRFTWLF